MLGLNLPHTDEPLKVLCLGAHCDDIEIGCGGTILELTANRAIDCTWVVFCSNEVRAAEAQACAEKFLHNAKHINIIIKDFRDGFLPYLGYEVKDFYEEIKQQVSPDLIFTHYRQDKHQDHRLVSELTLNTFRNHLILEYEIPKYDGDMGQPNAYVPVNEKYSLKKVLLIDGSYKSQRDKNWFDPELFKSLMRIRGMEINASERYAEAFYSYKEKLTI
ncbi:N-acetylglucosaminyl deacetylase, LmbE family [Desulfuromusa kysingii]|uniref:N-acetylglucosaminyl deacetylase, LmbE family n=1 Tax=Desulfuromusa kysingii TaxID=37625 RepID=A0A1H4B9T2_9BACT|nr:PIG-L deacetylase family protein [Desulfuromusa kysingii]SEA44901.1 N-acetylglucosaminyl deacetylase, LmbE family [Desulfuromusa kysingii]